MTKQDTEETKSYHDPMARRLVAAEARQQQLAAQYPAVNDVYDGFYELFEPSETEAIRFFSGPEGIIGSRLGVLEDWLVASDGRRLLQISGPASRRLVDHAAAGWQIVVLISVIYYRSTQKSVIVELGFICWDENSVDGPTMQTFCKNIADRIAHNDHAGLSLSQDQLVKVIDSQGKWFLLKSTPYPEREKGTIVYKSRRTGLENLVGYSMQHKVGCNIVANCFWVVLALVIIFLIWWFVH